MRFSTSLLAMAAVLAAASQSGAQTGAKAPTKRFLSIIDAKIGETDVPLDAVIREERVGSKTVSAELDACVPAAVNSRKLDHFLANLTSKGDALAADGATSDKVATSITLRRSGKGDAIEVTGKIRRGSLVIDISSQGLSYSPDDPRLSAAGDQAAVDEAVISPNALSVEVDPAHVADVLRALRTQSVRIDGETLYPTCDNIREKKQTLTLTVDPKRASAIGDLLKTLPGVASVRPGLGNLTRSNAVRFKPPAEAGKPAGLDEDALVARLADVVGTSLQSAKVSATRDGYTGEYVLVFKKPFELGDDPNESQTTEARILLDRADKTGGSMIVYVGALKITIGQAGDDTRAQVSDIAAGQEEEGGAQLPSSGPIVEALARALQGEKWDNDHDKWSK